MASAEEVQELLTSLTRRVDRIDPAYRAMLPSKRSITTHCPDIPLTLRTIYRDGRFTEFEHGATDKSDITLTCESDDLVRLVNREVTFASAYAAGLVNVRASVMDLIRLRAAL